MRQWMRRLAEKHRTMREAHSTENLMVVFDIDDTILDLRHMVLHVLRVFDRRHGTEFFQTLSLRDVQMGDYAVTRTLCGLGIPPAEMKKVAKWFGQYSWSSSVIREAHRPFPGVMEVIRWLQLQRRTFVGINTARPECIRRETLQNLHDIGQPHGVCFSDANVFMSRYDWGERIIESKVEGIRYLQQRYRIAAFIDNEPENLRAVELYDRSGEILLLHADTVFDGHRGSVPARAVSGRIYDVAELRDFSGRTDQLGEAA